MKKLFFIFVFCVNLFGGTEYQSSSNIPTFSQFIAYDSKHCYGTNESKNILLNVTSDYRDNSNRSYYGSNIYQDDAITHDGIPCATSPELVSNGIGNRDRVIYDYYSGYYFVYYKISSVDEIDLDPKECQDTPDNNIINGLQYQGLFATNSDCQGSYQDEGDGNGFQFVNLDLLGECAGFCYYNLPDSTDTGNNTDNTDTSNNNDNTDNTDTTNNTNNGTETDLSDLIPYLDEVEEKNQNIKDSLDTLNNNLNTQFNTINNNSQTLDSTMNNLDTTLSNINNSLQNLNSNNNDSSNDPDYSNVPNSLNINPDIDSELEGFKTDIENSLENSFSSYSNVFGFGGYGSAPAPITFSGFGKTYTIFDIKYLNPYIDHIRNIFLVTAYIFGLFLVFRGN